MTNPYEWHETDWLRGLRDFRRGRDTEYRDAFDIVLCRIGWGIIRIDAMIEDYLDAMAEASRSTPR